MTDDARKRQDAGRNRRYSEDQARKRWYAFWRTVRFQRRYGAVKVSDVMVVFRSVS